MKKVMLLLVLILLVGCIKTIDEEIYNVDATVTPFPIEAGVETTIDFKLIDPAGNPVELGTNYGSFINIFSEETGFNYEERDTRSVTLTFPKKGAHSIYLEFDLEDKDEPVIGDITLDVV